MLGIAVNIWRPIDPPSTPAHMRRGTIGAWEAPGSGMAGLGWLELLVANGRASFLGGAGYPYTYRIKASVLAEALQAGAPYTTPRDQLIVGEDYVARSETIRDFRIDWTALHECPPDEELFLEAWDLS
jgi:hypothetical protein